MQKFAVIEHLDDVEYDIVELFDDLDEAEEYIELLMIFANEHIHYTIALCDIQR